MIGPADEHRQIPIPVGVETAAYWEAHVARWSGTQQGPWLFSHTARRHKPVNPGGLGQRFRKLAVATGLPRATLHRLRHALGAHLVGRGDLLGASQRLRYSDGSFAHQQFGHLLPTSDYEVADRLVRIHGLDTPATVVSDGDQAR